VLIVFVVLSALVASAFMVGRRTAPTHRHPLVGSLDRALNLRVEPCSKPSNPDLGSEQVTSSVTISWQSGWKSGEFPPTSRSFGNNVVIGLAWDTSAWPFANMSVTAGGHGWSVAPSFTPSGRAAESWAVGQARLRNILAEHAAVPDDFVQGLSPRAGVWLLENFYDEKPRGEWTASFLAFARPPPSTVTIAMIDVDGSVIEKSVGLSCKA
jgi:hypothetical protein